MGYLEVWTKAKTIELNKAGLAKNLGYERVVQIGFDSQVICLNYNKSMQLLGVGTDQGQIKIYNFNLKRPTEIKLKDMLPLHNARVMSIVICDRRELMYSIGEDKYLKVYNLKDNSHRGTH